MLLNNCWSVIWFCVVPAHIVLTELFWEKCLSPVFLNIFHYCTVLPAGTSTGIFCWSPLPWSFNATDEQYISLWNICISIHKKSKIFFSLQEPIFFRLGEISRPLRMCVSAKRGDELLMFGKKAVVETFGWLFRHFRLLQAQHHGDILLLQLLTA